MFVTPLTIVSLWVMYFKHIFCILSVAWLCVQASTSGSDGDDEAGNGMFVSSADTGNDEESLMRQELKLGACVMWQGQPHHSCLDTVHA